MAVFGFALGEFGFQQECIPAGNTFIARQPVEDLDGLACAPTREHRCNAEAIVISARIEEELIDVSEEESREFLESLGVRDSGVSDLIRAVYHLLGLRTYLTTGIKETRAWTIPAGAKAPQAAGVIHTDFERGFIAAEVVHYDDLVSCGGKAGAREHGKLRIEGKEYVVKDGDVIEFRFNV